MAGCIHIYTGDGKGKTTAAVGLAVRFAGQGGKVLFSQFLKDGSSGEIGVLKSIPGIHVESFTEHLGFVFRMSEQQKAEAAVKYQAYLEKILQMALDEKAGLLVLDEIIGAYNHNLVNHDMLCDFLKHKPEELEVVLTGREPAKELCELTDYMSKICKEKHPFDEGIPARCGVEF